MKLGASSYKHNRSPDGRGKIMRSTILATAIYFSLANLAPAADAQAAMRQAPDIPPQALAPALQQLVKERDIQLVYRAELIADAQTNGSNGDFTPIETLTQLLSGTGLMFRYLDETTITIIPIPSGPGESSSRTSDTTSAKHATATNAAKNRKTPSVGGQFRLAEATQVAVANDDSGNAQREDRRPPFRREEVIVTATKRRQRLEDVPLSIAVIGNQDIERRGLIGMEDYLRSIPGVSQVDNGPRGNAIVIRGITTAPEGENTNGTTVATYFDETPITAAGGRGAGGIDLRPVDIERIEVLRGPQGTAYGSASLGGALRIIPTKPQLDDFGAKVAASYSSTAHLGGDNTMAQATLNLPLIANKVGVRAVGYRYEDSGFYENIAGVDPGALARAEAAGLGDVVQGFVEDDVGRMLTTGGRLAALWHATDRLNFNLNFLTQTIKQDGFPTATVGRYQHISIPIAPQGRVRGGRGENSDTEMDLLNLSMNYDFTWMALTSTASWIEASSIHARDQSEILPFYNTSTVPSDFDSFTAETRIATNLKGRWQFLGGLYYERVDDGSAQAVHWPGAATTNPFGTDPMAIVDVSRELDQRAIFGEVSYALTEKLTATLGGRYYKYTKDEHTLREGGLFRVPLGAGTPAVLASSEDGTNFKANLSYKPTTDSLLYASWSEGFRLGRPQAGLPPLTCDTNSDGLVDGSNISIESTRSVAPDSLDNYEVGGKFALFERRLAIDASVYHIKWDGLPTRTTATCGASILTYTTNAGGATSEGVEFQASLFVFDGLRFDFGAGYTNAKLSEAVPLQGWAEGARLPGSPKTSANLAAQYDFQIAGQRAFVRADSLYTGKFNGDLLGTQGLKAGGYTKIDARAGVAINNVSVELFIRNVTDEDAFTWQSAGGGTQPYVGFRLRPRTIGIQLGYDFE